MSQTETSPGPRLSSAASALLLGLVCTAQFMLILDISVANIALPSIGAELQLGRGVLTWVLTLYTLLFGGLMVLGGRLADIFGQRRILLLGLALFGAGSFLAGFSVDALTLLGGRALQGIGAALVSPAALSVITTRFSGPDRHRALGVWAAVGAVGAVAGVIVGGLLVAGPGWRWVFYITGPIAALLLVALAARLPAATDGARGRVDVPGAVLMTGATGLLIFGLTGVGEDGWSLPLTPLLLGSAVAGYLLFAAVERSRRQPLFDIRLFRARPISSGSALMVVTSALMAGGFFLGSFYLQQFSGWTPLATGFAFAPSAIATLVGAHGTGHLVSRVGGRTTGVAGLSVVVIGAAVAAAWMSPTAVIVGLTVSGLGLGAGFVVATTTALATVEHHNAGVVSGIVNTFHELGAALGVSLLSVVAIASLVEPTDDSGFTYGWAAAAAVALLGVILAAVTIPKGRPAGPVARFVH